MYNIIFTGDYEFQVLSFVIGSREKAWDKANEMYEGEKLDDAGVDHYDVATFNSISDMNSWILQQVKEGRENLKKG